jgi:transcriptional regulator with PAS, ATPase and Fis domain
MSSLMLETPAERLRSILTEEKMQLLTEYYSAEYGSRKAVAARYGMSMRELYYKIERIKKKILDNFYEV